MAKSSNDRFRNFATVVYPESAPEGWKDILASEFVPALISPLHNMDLNPGGDFKKAHYHVILMFDGPKTVKQAIDIFDKIGGVGCEIVNSIRGYARYLCHLDNPEKAQYKVDEVLSFCGADFHSLINIPSDKYKSVREMITFCVDEGIRSYSDLVEYAMMFREDWFKSLCDSSTYILKEYLKSKTWTDKE